jgi:hypothetical protein
MRLTFWTLQDAVAAKKEDKAQLATGYAWDPIESQYVTEPILIFQRSQGQEPL